MDNKKLAIASRRELSNIQAPLHSPSFLPTLSPREYSAIRELDPLLASLTPEATLEALQATEAVSASYANEENLLVKSIATASETERAFGIKAAHAAKKVKEWVARIEEWHAAWQIGGPPDRTEATMPQEEKVTNSKETLGINFTLFCNPYSETAAGEFEEFLRFVEEDYQELEIEEIKRFVLNAHTKPLSSGTSYKHLDDFTAVITATILQALPWLSRLASLLDTWNVRLRVARSIPGFMNFLKDAESAVAKLEAIPRGPEVEDLSYALIVERIVKARPGLELLVQRAADKLDSMLDTLDGRDRLPDEWLDRMEVCETQLYSWIQDSETALQSTEYLRSCETIQRQQDNLRAQAELATKHNNDTGVYSQAELTPKSNDASHQSNETSAEGVSDDKNAGSADIERIEGPESTAIDVEASPIIETYQTSENSVEASAEENLNEDGLELYQEIVFLDGNSTSDTALAVVEDTDFVEPASPFESDPERKLRDSTIESASVESSGSSHLLPTKEFVNSDFGEDLTPAHFDVASIRTVSVSSRSEGGYESANEEKTIIPSIETPDPEYLPERIIVVEPVIESGQENKHESTEQSPELTSDLGSPEYQQRMTPSPSPTLRVHKLRKLPRINTGPEKSVRSKWSGFKPISPLNLETGDEHSLPEPPDGYPPSFSSLESLDKDFLDSSPLSPPSGVVEDQLNAQISSMLNRIPAPIKLVSRPGPTLRAVKSRSSSLHLKSARSTRPSTPLATLAPAETTRTTRSRSDSAIKLYHLHQPGRSTPLKLHVRLVGENGERVMVRVGGGWADLETWLRDYALHHSRRTVSEGKFQVTDLSTPRPSPSATAASAHGIGSGRSTPSSDVAVRARKLSGAAIRASSMTPDLPPLPLLLRSRESLTPASGSTTPQQQQQQRPNMRSSSRQSFYDEDTMPLGLAGPSKKNVHLSPKKQAWVDGMMSQARQASAEKKKKVVLSDMGKVGSTRRVFSTSSKAFESPKGE